jgi:hypothetical protein
VPSDEVVALGFMISSPRACLSDMLFNVPASAVCTTGGPADRVGAGGLYARRVPNASAPRPATVTGAAAATALPGVLITVYGVYQLVAGLVGSPYDRAMAVTLGVIYLAFGLGICWVARGLLHCGVWARTPALLTFLANFGAAYWMIQGDYYLYAVLSIAYGLAGISLLFAPASHRVLTR